MDRNALLQGLYVPLVTPFGEDGHIAEDALGKLAYSALDEGAAGLVALGTTAESATLGDAEKQLILDVCAAVCTDRDATLITGAGTNDTGRTAHILRDLASEPAVDAALVPVPAFTRPSEAGVIAHFTELAAHSPVPLLVYNIPYRTGQTVSVDGLRRLAAIPGIAGVKHAAGSIDTDTVDLLGDHPDGFSILSGDDTVVSPMLALGATGGILGSANVETRPFVDLVSAWQAGDSHRARALGHSLAKLSAELFSAPNPTVIKGVLHAQGRIPTPAVRLPLLPADTEAVERAQARLAGVGRYVGQVHT